MPVLLFFIMLSFWYIILIQERTNPSEQIRPVR